jgi:hypothetical protein
MILDHFILELGGISEFEKKNLGWWSSSSGRMLAWPCVQTPVLSKKKKEREKKSFRYDTVRK